MCTRWREGGGSCWRERWNGSEFGKQAEDARRRKKKHGVIQRTAHLLQHETGGDPMQDLKWCRRATRQIAAELRRFHIRTSASTVRRLLKKMGFSLRVNHKRLESGNRNPPPRRIRNRRPSRSFVQIT